MRGLSYKALYGAIVLFIGAVSGTPAAADEAFVLLVQPTMGQERSDEIFRPFARYLETVTGRPCVIQAPPNFMAHWETLRRNHYDLALDASHFTDYRIRKFGFSALAKVPDAESYSLIVRDKQRAADPLALAAKRVATLGLPSMAAARLYAMFPNPSRQPVVVEVKHPDDGVALLLNKKVEAALLPTAFVTRRIEQGGVVMVLTTEPIPQLALSASPRVPEKLRETIRLGVLRAHETEAGRQMLRQIGFERFEPATAETFANQGNVLKGYWGY